MSTLKVPVSLGDHTRGDPSARVTMVEYGDYECPYCGLVHPVVEALRKAFPGDIRFVFRHFPLTQVHRNAEVAAEAAEFAGAHQRFWEMHDAIYENQDRLGLPLLLTLAAALSLSDAELQDDLAEGVYRQKVRSDFAGGVRSGVNGTPTFFINGLRHDGSYDFSVLAEAIANAPLRPAV